MEARLLSAVLSIIMVQVETAMQYLDVEKVVSLPCLEEVGWGWAQVSSYSSPPSLQPQWTTEQLPRWGPSTCPGQPLQGQAAKGLSSVRLLSPLLGTGGAEPFRRISCG